MVPLSGVSLVIDLIKGGWKEELHPRDKFGKFSTVKGGSRVVTSTGKTGVVASVTDNHYHVKTDEGKTIRVRKDNAIHENDHKKVMQAKENERKQKNKDKAKKSASTKASNKANGHGKTGASKLVVDPTSQPIKLRSLPKGKTSKKIQQEKMKLVEEQKKAVRKKVKEFKQKDKQRDMQAPAIAGNTINQNTSEVRKRIEAGNNAEVQAFQNAGMEGEKENSASSIDTMFDKLATPILKKAPEKRNAKVIQKVAGEITTANDKLARSIVLKMGAMRGLHLAGQVNKIGDIGQSGKGEVHLQETNYYGDMLQNARLAMFETLTKVLSGAQNVKPGVKIGVHIVNRMKQALHEDFNEALNQLPIPRETRKALVAVKKTEADLAQKLGRTPEKEELAGALKKNSDFMEAPIAPQPRYDEASGQWVASKEKVKDPLERLRLMKMYASQQKVGSIDENYSEDTQREQDIKSNFKDDSYSPEEQAIRNERKNSLRKVLLPAMRELGMDDRSILVMATMYSDKSRVNPAKEHLTMGEVAERLNQSSKWVDKWLNMGRKALKQAHTEGHPVFERLSMYKSFVFNMILKGIYEYDLLKSLYSWGIDHSILEERFVRVAYGEDIYELKKSMAPNEYIGTYVTTDTGAVHARIVELVLPETEELYKSFNAYMSGFQKSMFPHKGSSNHAINAKASAYIKGNPKFREIADHQQSSAKSKQGGKLTWSEELLIKNPGSAWITWGGKKLLVNIGSGQILYDSKNETHREDYNQGSSEDKIDFHHEQEELTEYEKRREFETRNAWSKLVTAKEAQANKGKGGAFDYNKEREAFAKKNRGVSFDEQGKLQFQHDTEIGEHNVHAFDHGISAFRDDMEKMRNAWQQKQGASLIGGTKKEFLDTNSHKALDAYADFSEEERAKLDSMSPEEKKSYIGQHFLNKEGVQGKLQEYYDAFHNGSSPKEAESSLRDFMKTIGSVAGRNKAKMDTFIKAVQKHDPSKEDSINHLAEVLGSGEMARAREEAQKNLIPEGKYMIGNPITGKTMVVNIGGGFSGGRAGKGGKYASELHEAFDPDGGGHEEIKSWGQLGKALGYTGKEAHDIKAILLAHANTEADKPFMRKLEDAEYNQHRSKTKLGLQESMVHKNFRLVDMRKDKAGHITGQTFAQDMPDGTQNVFEIDGKGYLKDPVLARLVQQRTPIKTPEDLHKTLQNAVGNRAWVTAHAGSDLHVGDALGHHIQLEYDGKGAPRVVGGKYDGYRYIDSRDVPKGATDPMTGEPVKALFKNGKLVDRKFTTKNKVPFKEGNAVLYPGEKGLRKGKIVGKTESLDFIVKHADGTQKVYKASQLKNAEVEGRTLSNSGQASVRLANVGTHRMDMNETFKASDPKEQKKLDKARKLFEEALQKADIKSDNKGNLELSDAMMKRLQKRLGRSKAGKALLKQFKSAYTKTLEIHVPENLRAQVEAEGVRVANSGTAHISVGKFEHLRSTLGGLSVDWKANDYLHDYFRKKDRVPKSRGELEASYQPAKVGGKLGEHYRAQFKDSSFLKDSNTGMYGTQLEGVSHLRDRGRAIAGHGMGTGKTITGVATALHYKAEQLANGQKPKKTLVVAPAGIRSDWGKEISTHTNSKALYIGSQKDRKKGVDGNYLKSENGRYMFGQDGQEQEHVTAKDFIKNVDKHAAEDHDFHVISYEQFMKMRDALSKAGIYDNIIVDEIHAFKNQAGQRGKSLAETTDRFKNVWGLSGTPMENDAREMYSLVDTITGGRHELGTKKEFTEKFLQKDKNGKITGVKESKAGELGDILANLVQFRGSQDVTYNDGSRIEFPQLIGQTSKEHPNPQADFMANMVDGSRDHKTTDYYGTKHSIFDFDKGTKTVTSKAGENHDVETFIPKNMAPAHQKVYQRYQALQQQHLPESKLAEMTTASITGYDNTGKNKGGNYLTAMQKLQKFLNAPEAEKMYIPGGGSALESDMTNAQGSQKGKKAGTTGFKEYNPETGEGNYITDEKGFKRYFESDGKGGFVKNADGTPKLLQPLHHNNPKAQYLKERLHKYLDNLAMENTQRRKEGKPELMPKVVLKSSYTTFGTDIMDNVLKEVQREHPELHRWADKLGAQGKELEAGRFTGDADNREDTKTGFRGNKADYANNQGHLWATTVSPAGKEGVDFGNAHMMFHYDQDWNPQKMAQFTARVRRSDSHKSHTSVDRANAVRVESLHMPGTIEDFLFNAEDAKMHDIGQVTQSTKEMEQAPRYGETDVTNTNTARGFTRNSRRKAGAKPKPIGAKKLGDKLQKPQDSEVKVASLKLVVIL